MTIASFKNKQIFTDTMEDELADFIIMFENISRTTALTQYIAYEYAIDNNIKVPESWITNEAGKDWLAGFMIAIKLFLYDVLK